MNENFRYIFLIVGAVVLMAVGFWGAYAWQQRRTITRSSAQQNPRQIIEQAVLEPGTSNATGNSAHMDRKQAEQDSIAKRKKELEIVCRAIRLSAEEEGYVWQKALSEYRFREPAELCLNRMKEHGDRLRDSLAGVYVSHESKDSLLTLFDDELDAWHVRLLQQVIMLPTAQQALEAKQITREEYDRIVAPVRKKK